MTNIIIARAEVALRDTDLPLLLELMAPLAPHKSSGDGSEFPTTCEDC